MVRGAESSPPPEPCTDRASPPLDEYRRIGEGRRVSWNSLREQILALLWRTRTPWGAYGIAHQLSSERDKKHPNSVYRSMRILESARLVIPIVSWSRYVISPDPGIGSWGVILCSKCRSFAVVPMEDERRWLWSVARGFNFRADRAAIECHGKCQACSVGNAG